MNKYLLFSFYFICLIFSKNLNGQKSINFLTLDVRSGISDNYIHDILQDEYGFMWFATLNGLNRYDGYHFKRYTTTQIGSHNNNIESVQEDGAGTIWVKTQNELYFYDREKDELINDINKQLEKLDISGNVDNLFIDEDRNLWCSVNNKIHYYQFKAGKLQSFMMPERHDIMDIACRNSVGWLLFDNGNILYYDSVTETLRKETRKTVNPGFKSKIYIDNNHNLWFYTLHNNDLNYYSRSDKTWKTISSKESFDISNNVITSLIDDGKGNIWIGTDNKGIYIYNNLTDSFQSVYYINDKLFTLPSNHITCFYKDNKDVMWVGTSKQGVAYSHLNNTNFENYIFADRKDISCIIEDNNKNIWYGFDGEGLCRIDGKSNEKRYFNSHNREIPSDLIVCSYADSENRLWWGSFGKGAFYYENGVFTDINEKFKNRNTDFPYYIRRITEDKLGNIWLATYTQGVYCLDKEGKFTNYNISNSTLLTNYIADLSYSDGQYLYIATSSGIYSIDIVTRIMTIIGTDKSGNAILRSNSANCIYKDSRNLLWIGEQEGISIYDVLNNRVEYLSLDNGLSSIFTHSICEDENNNIWLATDNGITHICIRKDNDNYEYHCFPYYKEDYIENFKFNNFSILRNSNNDIIIGGNGGFVKINPGFSDFRHDPNNILFTDLYLANEHISVGKETTDGRVLLPRNIQMLDEITLNYSDSHFALEVSAMDYINQHKRHYEYRLGNRDEWIKLERNRIYFNRLSPGLHTLYVKVAGLETNSSNTVKTLTIIVKPPFWLSPFAYAIYILLSLSLIIAIFMIMRRKQQRIIKEKKREMEITKLQEMNDAKINFFTNISHDLRTPLSLIITPLEKLLSVKAIKEYSDDLNMIHRNAMVLMNEMDQLLDIRKLDKNKVMLNTSYGNISEFVKDICHSFRTLAVKDGITISLRIDNPVIEMNFDKNKMQRILFNLLSNAIKYNVTNGSVTVNVNKIINAEGEHVIISIADTGIGIMNENKENIFDCFFQENQAVTKYMGSGIGLHIVKEYVTLHEGSIKVEDNKPQGSVFIVTIPIKGSCNVILDTEIVKEKPQIASVVNKQEKQNNKKKEINVLVVEDNAEFRHFLMNSLNTVYKVYEAENGKEALYILASENIDIIISDIMMPVMDGMELCHQVKSNINYSHIPVIMLTAKSSEENILDGFREGADDYITKPFNLELLLLKISKILKWTESNHEKFRKIDVAPSEITVSTLDEILIAKAIKCVEDNMGNPDFTVEDLSSYVGMSRGHLYRKLNLITGKSPLEFIRTLQIKRGRQLLEKSQLSISQIAYEIGLSPKQFTKSFKDEFGCLPSEFDKKKVENL